MHHSTRMRHEFVENIPDGLKDGVLYVSITYATVSHKCCCGCGHEVVTPLTPSDWQLTFDGESVSLHPSIGNWSLDCRSHYWVKRNQLMWAGEWTEEQISSARAADRRNKAATYAEGSGNRSGVLSGDGVGSGRVVRGGIWSRLKRLIFGE